MLKTITVIEKLQKKQKMFETPSPRERFEKRIYKRIQRLRV